jgi:hypothetical protein
LNSNIDKQEMQSYLLGTLEADRRVKLEETILGEREVYEELLIVEQELIDQYLADELSGSEWQQFENHFLITAERQKNLHFGKLLKRYVDSQPQLVLDEEIPTVISPIEKSAPAKRSFYFLSGPLANRPALALFALLVALGIIFLVWLAPRNPEQDAHETAPPPLVITLAPGSLRSAGTTQPFHVQPKGADIKLQLELARPAFPKYRSQLLRESEMVQTTDELKSEAKGDQHIVPLTVPAEMLSPGNYQVRLSGVLNSGQDEFIDNYSFRVIK